MPRDRTAAHRRAMLATDAAELRRIDEIMRSLLAEHLPLKAREMQSDATGDALVKLAQALAGTMHDAWADVIAAHDAATDEEGIKPLYVMDTATAVTFGMASPELVRQPIELADVEHLRAAE